MAFFAKGDRSIIDCAKKRWPGCSAKVINSPFRGIGVAGPYIHKSENHEIYEKFLHLSYDIQDNLPEFSKKYPDTVFVFVEVDCSGGICHYDGYVCRNNKILAKKEGKEALKHLMKHLDVKLGENQFFEPFQRDFF